MLADARARERERAAAAARVAATAAAGSNRRATSGQPMRACELEAADCRLQIETL